MDSRLSAGANGQMIYTWLIVLGITQTFKIISTIDDNASCVFYDSEAVLFVIMIIAPPKIRYRRYTAVSGNCTLCLSMV